MRALLLIVAAWASICFIVLAGLDADPTAPFVVAALCLAGFFWLDYRAAQRTRAQRDQWLDDYESDR
jgi:hypothetical protein